MKDSNSTNREKSKYRPGPGDKIMNKRVLLDKESLEKLKKEKSERKLFGTDGIRGKANIYPMTSEVATALGRAVTHYFQTVNPANKQPLIIVGKDTRLSCYM